MEVIKLFHSSSQSPQATSQDLPQPQDSSQDSPQEEQGKTNEKIKDASFNAALEVIKLFHSSSQSPQATSQDSSTSPPQDPPQEEQGIIDEKIKDASFNAALEVLNLFHSSSQLPQATSRDSSPPHDSSQLIIEEQAIEKVKKQPITLPTVLQQAPLKIPTGASLQLKATFNFLNLFHNLPIQESLDLSLTSNVETPPEAAAAEEAQKAAQKAAEEAQTETQKETPPQPKAQTQIVKQAPLKIPEEASPQLEATFNFLNLFHS